MSKVNYRQLNPANVSYVVPRSLADFSDAVYIVRSSFKYFNASLATWITNNTLGYVGIKVQLVDNQSYAIAQAQQIARFSNIQYLKSDTFDDGTSLVAYSKRVPLRNESSILVTYIHHEKPQVVNIYPCYNGRFELTTVPNTKSFIISYIRDETHLILRQYTINNVSKIEFQNRSFEFNQDPENVDFYLASFYTQNIYFIWSQSNDSGINLEKMNQDISNYIHYNISSNPRNILFDSYKQNDQEKIAFSWLNINNDNTTHYHLITINEQYIINNQRISPGNYTDLLSISILSNLQIFCLFKTNSSLNQKIILANGTILESFMPMTYVNSHERDFFAQAPGCKSMTPTTGGESTTVSADVKETSSERPPYTVIKDGKVVNRNKDGSLAIERENTETLFGQGNTLGGAQVSPTTPLSSDQRLQLLLKNIQKRDAELAQAELEQFEEIRQDAKRTAVQRQIEADKMAQRAEALSRNAKQQERDAIQLEKQYAEENAQKTLQTLNQRNAEADKMAQRAEMLKKNALKAQKQLEEIKRLEDASQASVAKQLQDQDVKYQEEIRAQAKYAMERRLALPRDEQKVENIADAEIRNIKSKNELHNVISARIKVTQDGVKSFLGEGRILGGRKPLPSETIAEARSISLPLRNEVVKQQQIVEQELQKARVALEEAQTAVRTKMREKITQAIEARQSLISADTFEKIQEDVIKEVITSQEVKNVRTQEVSAITNYEALALEATQTREIAVEEAEATAEDEGMNTPNEVSAEISLLEPMSTELIPLSADDVQASSIAPSDSQSLRKTRPKALVSVSTYSSVKVKTSSSSSNSCKFKSLKAQSISSFSQIGIQTTKNTKAKVVHNSTSVKNFVYLSNQGDYYNIVTGSTSSVKVVNSQKYVSYFTSLNYDGNELGVAYTYYNITDFNYQFNIYSNKGNFTNLFKIPKNHKGIFAADMVGTEIITASMIDETMLQLRKFTISNSSNLYKNQQLNICEGYPTLLKLRSIGDSFILVYGSPSNQIINIQCRQAKEGVIIGNTQISTEFSKIFLDVLTSKGLFIVGWQNTYGSDIDALSPAKVRKYSLTTCSQIESDLTISSPYSTREELHSVRLIDVHYLISAFSKSSSIVLRIFKDREVWDVSENPNQRFINNPEDIEINYLSNFNRGSSVPESCEVADIFVSYTSKILGQTSIWDDNYQMTRGIE